MNGKGDKPRPLSVERETFHNNWERIFGKKNKHEWYQQTESEHDAPERSEAQYGEYPRVDEDGNRIEQEPC